MSTTITIDGNIVAEPSLRFTPSGHAVATFTVAVSNRQKKAGEWVDAPATYHDIEAWNALAEHCADSLGKGTAVILTGVIRTHAWQDKDTGQTRSRNIIAAHNVAVSLKYATATIHAAQRRSATDQAPDSQSMQDSDPAAQL